MRKGNKIVIYTRGSSAKANAGSFTELAQKLCVALEHNGIDLKESITIHRGRQSDAASCNAAKTLAGLAKRKEIDILILDRFARIPQAEGALAIFADILESGGRIISVGDNIEIIREEGVVFENH